MSDQKQHSTFDVIVGIATVIGAIAIVSKLFSRDKEEEKADRSREGLYKEIPPTKRDFVYKDWADTLDNALNHNITEDENAVYAVFAQMKNISDVNKTIQAYGARRAFFSMAQYTLPQIINNTFSRDEKKALNGILARKGISYSF